MTGSPDRPYLEPEVETMPRARLESLQEEQMLRLVPYAYERAPLYRELWDEAGVHPNDIKGMEDFVEHVPFLSKAVLSDYRERTGDPFGGVLCVPHDEVPAAATTSGTTGEPTLLAWDEGDYPPLRVNFARGLWGLGLRPGDFVLESAGVLIRGPGVDAYRLLGAVPISVDITPGDWTERFDLIERYRPAYMMLLGAQLAELADTGLADDEIAARLSCFRFVTFTGEPLGRAMREKMRDRWGLEVFQISSAGEHATAWECTARAGNHVWEDCVLAENLDPETGADGADGATTAELVTTSLDNLTAPLVRYRTGDLGVLDRRACACGRTHARHTPLGRAGDQISVAGRLVLPLDVWRAVESEPETMAAVFQMVCPTAEVDRLHLRVGYNEALTVDPDDLARRLVERVGKEIGSPPAVELLPEGQMIAASAGQKLPPRLVTS